MITVSKKDNAIMWIMAENVPPNTEVLVHDGCVALVRRNGSVVNTVYPGAAQIVNLADRGGLFRRSVVDNGVWDIVGVNTVNVIEIPWGVNVPYVDKTRDNLPGKLSANGKLCVKVTNAETCFTCFFSVGGVTAKDIIDRTRAEVQTAVSQNFADLLTQHGGLVAMRQAKISLSEATRKRLSGRMFESYGFDIKELQININSDGFEHLDKLKNERAVTEVETDIIKKQSEGAKAVLEVFSDKSDSKSEKTIKLKDEE